MSNGEGRSTNKSTEQRQADEAARFEGLLGRGTAICIGIIAAVTLVFAWAIAATWSERFQVAGSAIAVTTAAAVVGALLGFIFGIPQALQRDQSAGQSNRYYLSNTNLVQISDWVTKVLVGISLVQIGTLGPALGRLGSALAPMLGGDPASPGFGLAISIFAVVAGFLLTYMWTRVAFWRVLEYTERDMEELVQQAVEKTVGESSATDAKALSLLDRQLSGQEPTPDELSQAFAQASKPTLVQVYQKAENQRRNTWRDREPRTGEPRPWYREQHDRTIGVFEALLKTIRRRNSIGTSEAWGSP